MNGQTTLREFFLEAIAMMDSGDSDSVTATLGLEGPDGPMTITFDIVVTSVVRPGDAI